MKHIIILGDGMADWPVKSLGDKTLLQYAETPYMDKLARMGRNGRLITVAEGFHPGSEVANMSVLGYNLPKVYEGRGPLEAASIGVDLKPGEMAMRCNLICVEGEILKNHSSGHISTEEADVLIQYLQEKLGNDRVRFHTGVQYRHLLVIKGGNKELDCTPPHDVPLKPFRPLMVKPLVPEAQETADLINDLILKSQELLKNHPLNLKRMSEGIEVNPVVFDLLNEMRWRSEHLDLDVWLKEYSVRRYGVEDENLKEAWTIFHRTAYGTYTGHRRPSESVFCAPPSLKRDKITASAWSQCRIFYDPELFAQGVGLFLQSADRLKQTSTYQYDAVDFVRQYLADLGREAYYNLVDAYRAKDTKQFDYWSERFLQLIKDQNELLSTHECFFVGRWLDMARSKSKQPELQDLYEHNARMLIGTWTETLSPVRDYAHKEWGGLLKDYYLPRWTNYIAYLKGTLEGRSLTVPDSFQVEKAWVNAHNKYVLETGVDPVETAKRMYRKYHI